MEEIVNHCKRRGIIFDNSGPYDQRDFTERRGDCVQMETAVILNPRVWQASGHVQRFVDPLAECAQCRTRVRLDKLIDAALERGGAASLPAPLTGATSSAAFSLEDMTTAIRAMRIPCPQCGSKPPSGLGAPRMFNLLFETHVGPVDARAVSAAEQPGGSRNPNHVPQAYLRPETAQGVYVHFSNVIASTRRRLPLGIGQVGKSFRNEIAVGNFIFRTREFDQMELQYFCAPTDADTWYAYWVDFCEAWLRTLGLRDESVRRRVYAPGELAHYARATTDLQFKFPFGWDELWGIANRGDFDLKAHAAASGHSFTYTDPSSKQTYTPFVIEPALGLNRLLLAVLCDALCVETVPGSGKDCSEDGGSNERIVMRIHEDLAPIRVAVLPVVKSNVELLRRADSLHAALCPHLPCELDATQSIGKRYRRQDEIGTPYCITLDNDTLTHGTVTVRERDSMQQKRVHLDAVLDAVQANSLNAAAWARWAPS